jgi:hypothetical protein
MYRRSRWRWCGEERDVVCSLLRAACLLVALAGCTPVLSEQPVGTAPAALEPDQVEGVWVSSSAPGEMYCCTFIHVADPHRERTDGEQPHPSERAGRFAMINVNRDAGRLFALHWDGRFTMHRDAIFANISLSSTGNATDLFKSWGTGAYLFGWVKIRSRDEIRIRMPDKAAFSKSIAEGHLPAGEGCREKSICLGPMSAAQLDFLTAPGCLEIHFKEEIVLRRFPFSPS